MEVLQGVEDERNILQTTKQGNLNWTVHILHRNCFLTHYYRKDGGKDRSERKMMKQMSVTNG
jgi:hypothetical protein